jgi:hypothetical protein
MLVVFSIICAICPSSNPLMQPSVGERIMGGLGVFLVLLPLFVVLALLEWLTKG